MRFTLTNESPTLKCIRQKGKIVGRVVPHADGGWLAIIGRDSVRSSDPVAAFREVTSRSMGYANAADLHDHNRAVQRRRRQHQANLDQAINELFRGRANPLDALVDALLKSEKDGESR